MLEIKASFELYPHPGQSKCSLRCLVVCTTAYMHYESLDYILFTAESTMRSEEKGKVATYWALTTEVFVTKWWLKAHCALVI